MVWSVSNPAAKPMRPMSLLLLDLVLLDLDDDIFGRAEGVTEQEALVGAVPLRLIFQRVGRLRTDRRTHAEKGTDYPAASATRPSHRLGI